VVLRVEGLEPVGGRVQEPKPRHYRRIVRGTPGCYFQMPPIGVAVLESPSRGRCQASSIVRSNP